jgi:pimeloyl-ACP methyl ester carboxylesterase
MTVPGTTERTVRRDDADIVVYEAGPTDGPVVLLSHGFPELAYSWRHQIPALAEAGYHVLAPDQRGYGRSSRPEAVEAYDIEHLTGDLVAILDDVGAERAAVVGHDWGSMVVSHTALLHPDRVAGLVNLSVPHLPRAPMPPVQAMRMALGDRFFYIVYFQEPGVADEDLGREAATTMRRLLAGVAVRRGDDVDPSALTAADGRGFVDRLPEPDDLPGWLSQAELDHYTAEFERTGFTGGINWYRNLDRNWELTPQLEGAKVEIPSLFIGGGDDPVLLMSPPSIAEAWVTDHRGDVIVEGAGHWVQQETPGPVNDALLTFCRDLPDWSSAR